MSLGLVAILLLVFGMMTWPILLLKPKPAQKKREALYAQAAALGIKMQQQAPSLPPLIEKRYHHLSYCLGFSKPITHGLLSKTYTAIRNPESNEWFWPSKERPNAAILQALVDAYTVLPPWCLAVEQGPTHTTIYALEKQLVIGAVPSLLDSLNLLVSKPLANNSP